MQISVNIYLQNIIYTCLIIKNTTLCCGEGDIFYWHTHRTAASSNANIANVSPSVNFSQTFCLYLPCHGNIWAPKKCLQKPKGEQCGKQPQNTTLQTGQVRTVLQQWQICRNWLSRQLEYV